MNAFAFVLSVAAAHAVLLQPAVGTQRFFGSRLEPDLAMFFRLTGRGFTAPLHWEKEDWRTAGGIILCAGVSSVLDDDTYAAALRNRTDGHDRLERVFEAYGNALNGMLISGALYGSGLAFDSEWLRGTGLVMASALTISAVTQTTIKYIAGRARPYTGFGYHRFRPFSFHADFVSFPSGHTIVAFTISTVLAQRLNNVYASIVLYAAAAMGGVSRIYSSNHWLSDVVFGAGLSYAVSHSVVKWYEEETGRESHGAGTHIKGLEIHPAVNQVTLVWKF